MMKEYFKGLLFILLCFIPALYMIPKKSFAVEVVLDLETHQRLNNINKEQLKQGETLDKLEDNIQEIQTSLTGRYNNGNSTTSNDSYNQDIANVNTNHTLKKTKINQIEYELDSTFQEREYKTTTAKQQQAKKLQQTQDELRQSIIYASSIINGSNRRNAEIEALVLENGRTEGLKEAIDLQNKIAIEALLETKRNNNLLALLVRNNAQEKYQGKIRIVQQNEQQDSFNNIPSGNNNSMFEKYAR